jgi:hypothetical protein
MADDDRITALQRELDALKRALPVTSDERAAMDRAAKEWANEMHQLAEARMAHAAPFTREDIAAFDRACPPSVSRDIASRGGIKPPSADGCSGVTTSVHRSPGLFGTQNGWVEPRPMGPPPGVAAADRLMDEADRRDRIELAERLAKARRIEDAARKAIAGS